MVQGPGLRELQRIAVRCRAVATYGYSLRQFWAKVQGKPVKLVAGIVAVKRETQDKVVIKMRPVAPWNPSKRLRKSGPPVVLSEDKQRRHIAAKLLLI